DRAPTLGAILNDAQQIALVEVDRFSRDNAAVLINKVSDLKGVGGDRYKLHLTRPQSTTIPRSLLQWAQPGQQAMLFVSRSTLLICLGQTWFQFNSSADGWWYLGVDRPELPLAYSGSLARLS